MQSRQMKSNTAELEQQHVEGKKKQPEISEEPGVLTKDYTPLDNVSCRIGDDACAAKHVSVIERTGMLRSIYESQKVQSLLRLQQQYGNRFVQRLIAQHAIQTKLKVGQPGDIYEQEADRVANQVIRMPDTQLQRQKGGERPNQAQSASRVKSLTRYSGGGGQHLPDSVLSYFEPRFGHDFSQVHVHHDVPAARTARQLNARAFTIGRNIVFAENRYQPESTNGRRLLAHELTHVIQQSQSNNTPLLQRAETHEEVGCTALKDSASDFNAKVNSELAAAVATVGTPIDPEQVIKEVADRLGGVLPVTPIERFAEASLPSDKIKQPAKSHTKYKNVTAALWMFAARVLGPHVKINGICVGTDKLGHFFQQGYQYYQITQSSILAAVGPEAFGRRWEIKLSGLAATGVFSNADLEANRQGLKFYKDLKANPTMTFDIKSYISSNWNEARNPSFYSPAVATTVWGNLLSDHQWRGSFGTSSPAFSTGIEVDFTISGGVVSGIYQYTDQKGNTIMGTISSGTITQSTTTLSGARGSTASAVTGITLNFEWMEGSNRGRAALVSKSEHNLEGTWGYGASSTNGGHWKIIR